jgi:predicted dehydrogenase
LEGDPTVSSADTDRGVIAANKRVVDDWLAAIRDKREPICSGRQAMKSLEMIMAVFQAGLTGTRVTIPMNERRHPLRRPESQR